MTTSEQWLTEAVKALDKHVFDGELHTDTHGFQIYFGRIKGKKGTETVQPSDAEAVTLEDFFPTTIGVDYTTQDVDRMLVQLTMECIKAFMGVTKGKAFKKKCEEYWFEKPFSEAHASPYLKTCIADARSYVEHKLGEFPGKPVKFPTKEPKEKKKPTTIFFCPECGIEFSAKNSKLKGATGTPVCICGAKMGRDLSDETNTETEEAAKD